VVGAEFGTPCHPAYALTCLPTFVVLRELANPFSWRLSEGLCDLAPVFQGILQAMSRFDCALDLVHDKREFTPRARRPRGLP